MKSFIFSLFLTASMMLFAAQNDNNIKLPNSMTQRADGFFTKNDNIMANCLKNFTHGKNSHRSHVKNNNNGLFQCLVPFGSFFTVDSVVINPGASIPFNQTTRTNCGLLLDPQSGTISVEQSGDYLVIYGVSTSIPPFNRYALSVNGVAFADGSNVSSDGPQSGFLTTISTTVRISPSMLPATLNVINFGEAPFTLFSSTPGDITAFITLVKLSSNGKSSKAL